MAYYLSIFLCSMCFISIKAGDLREIYLVNDAEDTVLLKNYDDYDLINEFGAEEDYSEWDRHAKFYKTLQDTYMNKLLTASNIRRKKKNMCQRVFGSMYGNTEKQIRCLQSLNNNQRSDNIIYAERPKPTRHLQYHAKPVIQKRNDHDHLDFSQDYLDVKDLGRMEGFSSDYLDIDDIRTVFIPDCYTLVIDEFGQILKTKC